MAEIEGTEVPVEIIDGQVEEELVMRTITANFSKTGPLRIVESHFWHGHAVEGFANLPIGVYANPKQTGTLPEGIKFGFVFTDGPENSNRKFVAAFDCPAGKAYAEAGPVGPVDWDVVEVKLGMSGSKSDYTDHILGGRTLAEVSATTGVSASAKFYN